MVSVKEEWREKSEGTLENINYIMKNRKLKIKDFYSLIYAIGCALVSISYPKDK